MSDKNKNTNGGNKDIISEDLDDLSLEKEELSDNSSEFSDEITDNEDNISKDESGKNKDNSSVNISKSKAVLIRKILKNIQQNSDQLSQLLSQFLTKEEEERISLGQLADEADGEDDKIIAGSRIIEGVFTGEYMIGPDGKQYSVPANYASKSKLVEGDILKLTITDNGTFVYKQISPMDRKRLTGKLKKIEDRSFMVIVDDKKWRVLNASVTYYKGEPGDEVIILVPRSEKSQWAAVENIIKNIEIN